MAKLFFNFFFSNVIVSDVGLRYFFFCWFLIGQVRMNWRGRSYEVVTASYSL